MTLFLALLSRDLKIALRSGGGWFYALFFFAVFTALSGIAFGPSLAALAVAAPAAIWLAAALAIQFAATDLFETDMRDGSLRAMAAEQESLVPYWGAKSAQLAATAAAPMVLTAPFFLIMLGVPIEKGPGLAALLAAGAPALIAVAVLTSALAAGLRAGGLLAMIIAAPLAAPALIFGVGAAKAFLASGVLLSPETLILGALSLFMIAATPVFAIAALRLSLE
ncbi:MAG: heme exporter protein CcmB [Parvularculaceae bacterium]